MTSVIVLVGTTGSGKSTTGNLFVDPDRAKNTTPDSDDEDDVTLQQKIFKEDPGPSACTSSVQSHCLVDDQEIEIVDTPGFDESPEKDAEHTIKLLKKLRSVKKISAVILCHSGKAEGNFYQLLEYVARLFTPKVMDKNFLILYTKMPTSRSALVRYPMDRRNADMSRVQEDVRSAMGMDHVVPLFPIDSCPKKTKSVEWEKTIQQRNNVLQIIKKMEPVDVSMLMFPKSRDRMDADMLMSAKLSAELVELQHNLVSHTEEEKQELDYIADLEKRSSDITIKIRSSRDKIRQYDTDELVVTGEKYGYKSSGGELIITVNALYPLASGTRGYSISKIDKVDKETVKSRSEKQIVVSLKPSTPLIGRTGGTVTCYSLNKVVKADTIRILNEQLQDYESQENQYQRDIQSLKDRSSNIRKQYTVELEQKINNIKEKRAQLEKVYLDLDEVTVGDFLADEATPSVSSTMLP